MFFFFLMFTVNHKIIGVMYTMGGFTLGIVAWMLSVLMRIELSNPTQYIITHALTDWYMNLVTLHGVLMIFMLVMPVLWGGNGNVTLPLYLGLPEVALPRLNNASILIWYISVMMSTTLLIEGASSYGWTLYPTLSTTMSVLSMFGIVTASILLLVNGISSTLTASNFVATWLTAINSYDNTLLGYTFSNIVTSILLILVLPVLTAALVHLYADVTWNTAHYTVDFGGEPVSYQHIFWVFGHPEVYILILPGFALVTVNTDTNASTQTFGMVGMLNGIITIAVLGFIVWAHHMYTTGNEADTVVYFGVATMAIAIPSGIKILHWLTVHACKCGSESVNVSWC
jgi:heme/copper-type cytochrome/quinol oxidase subunit 1